MEGASEDGTDLSMPSAQCRALNTSARQLQSEAKVRKAAAWTEAGALGHASASRRPHLAGGDVKTVLPTLHGWCKISEARCGRTRL